MTKKAAHNIGLAIWRMKCFYETFVQGSTAVILLNFSAKNPPHRQAENRCVQHIFRTYAESFSPIFFRKKFIEIVTEKFCVIVENRTELCR